MIGLIPDLKQQTIGNVNHIAGFVEIYILPDCPLSKRALKLLDSYKIKYNSYLITGDDEFKKISNRTSFNTFPQIFIKNKFIGGYFDLLDLSNNGKLLELVA